jgi:lipid-A-disaccharide synthase-like uncharacterized protein
MQTYLIFALGFAAQTLFAARMIVQWIQSERAGRVISPTLFWQTSLVASFLLMLYGILRGDVVIFAGQLISYGIYIRNLQLKNAWRQIPLIFRALAFAMPVLLGLWLMLVGHDYRTLLLTQSDFSHPLMIAGAIGQGLSSFRFIYQWYVSEKARASVFPLGFWGISLAGAWLVLAYAVYRFDPVLLLAQVLGVVIYTRNIMLGKNAATEG